MSSPSSTPTVLSRTTPCFVCGAVHSDAGIPLPAREFDAPWRMWLRAFWERRHPSAEGPAATRALRTCHSCADAFTEDGLGRCAALLAGAADGEVSSTRATSSLPPAFLRPLARELLRTGTVFHLGALWPQESAKPLEFKRSMDAFTRLFPPELQPRWGYYGSRGHSVVTFAHLLGLSGLSPPAALPAADARSASLQTALEQHVQQRMASTFHQQGDQQTAQRQEAEQAKLRELLVAGDSHAYLQQEYGADLPRAVLRLVGGGDDDLLAANPSAPTPSKTPQQQRLAFTLALLCGMLVALRCEINNTNLPKPALAAFLSVALRTLSHNQLVKLLAPSGLVTGVKYARAHIPILRVALIDQCLCTGKVSSSGSLCRRSSAPST